LSLRQDQFSLASPSKPVKLPFVLNPNLIATTAQFAKWDDLREPRATGAQRIVLGSFLLAVNLLAVTLFVWRWFRGHGSEKSLHEEKNLDRGIVVRLSLNNNMADREIQQAIGRLVLGAVPQPATSRSTRYSKGE
jgi:hypothetical protein